MEYSFYEEYFQDSFSNMLQCEFDRMEELADCELLKSFDASSDEKEARKENIRRIKEYMEFLKDLSTNTPICI